MHSWLSQTFNLCTVFAAGRLHQLLSSRVGKARSRATPRFKATQRYKPYYLQAKLKAAVHSALCQDQLALSVADQPAENA